VSQKLPIPSAGSRPPATELAFGRKGQQAAVGPTEEAPTDASGVRTESRHQDFRDSWLAAPGQLHRPVAVGLQVSAW
jgi:hypothetical protein